MSITPVLEKRRVRISTGLLDSGTLQQLADTHPFIQQETLDAALTVLESCYYKGKTKITDMLNRGAVDDGSGILMLTPGMSGSSSDAWCIDPRGVLTLSVCKETYETLGLAGQSLPFKGHTDQHVIQLPLKKNTESAIVQAKQKAFVEAWEEQRKTQDGLDGWDIAYCSQVPDVDADLRVVPGAQVRRATCTKKQLQSIHIPVLTIVPRPDVPHGKGNQSNAVIEKLEDWNGYMMELYEWVGLAMLGSQRLQANDQVNPFVAVYEPPQPSQIGDATHLAWRGLLSPKLIQSIINAACVTLDSVQGSLPFVTITCHGIPVSPVGYLPPQSNDVPVRLPRTNSEDSFTLILGHDASGKPTWCLLESIGQWDTRWG